MMNKSAIYNDQSIIAMLKTVYENQSNEFQYVRQLCYKLRLPIDQIDEILLGVELKDMAFNDAQKVSYEDHPELGHLYLKNIVGFIMTKEIVLLHHERNNGSGFPYGLMEPEIPRHVQIVGLVDEFCAELHEKQDILLINRHRYRALFDYDLVELFFNEIV